MDNIKLYNGDCLDVMDKLIKEGVKVDAIITDIPQEITQNDWDRAIPLKKMWDRLYKIRRNIRTPIVLFSNQPFTTDLIASNRKHFKYMRYWHKDRPSGFLNAKRQPLRDVEEIITFYENQCLYNPQFWEGEPLHGLGNKYKEVDGNNNNYGNFDDNNEIRDARKSSTQKYPRQMLSHQRPHPPIHPTEKPVSLLEDLILTHTNENDTVLDFTIGSGTTGVAAKNLNRKFIGIELDKKYFEIAKERIENHNVQERLI